MKELIKKYWPVIYGVLIAVYEAYAFISGSDYLPKWVKGVIGIVAFIGLIAKNYKPKK